MVIKVDQERVKTILTDTIVCMCRNVLTYKSKLSIEALIGVTLDDDDVYLISINELIEKAVENNSQTVGPDNLQANGEIHKHKRWKQTVSTESGIEPGSSGKASEESDGVPVILAHGIQSAAQSKSEPAAKRFNKQSVKQEKTEKDVFIKEPQVSSWQLELQPQQPQSTNMYSNISETSNSVSTESGSEPVSSGKASEESDGVPVILAHGNQSAAQSKLEPAAKRFNKQSVKQEKTEIDVFIKEPQVSSGQLELQPQQPQSAIMYSNISGTSNSGFGDDQNFSSISDMSLKSVGYRDKGAMWTPATQMTSPMQQLTYHPRGIRTSTVTSEGQGDGQTPERSGQDTSQVGAIIK